LSEPLSLCWVDAYDASLHTNAQVVDTGLLELALGQLEEEELLLEHLKDFLYNLPVPFKVIFSGNQDIIHVDKDFSRVAIHNLGKDMVYTSLEGGQGVL
jgi:hypothetical protein